MGDLDRSIKLLQERLDNAQTLKGKLQANIVALKGKPTPPELADQIRRNELEIQSVSRELESKKKDLDRVDSKYETERKRFRELRGESNAGVTVGSGPQVPTTDAPAAAPASAPPTASPPAKTN